MTRRVRLGTPEIRNVDAAVLTLVMRRLQEGGGKRSPYRTGGMV
jgi:hypothetical protein